MGTNLVGPFGEGVNQTYDTPEFPDSGDSQFSWFVDCSNPVTPDGTRWMANWANRMMQQVRRAVVGMGVTPIETDGDALQKAIMRAHRPIVNIGGGIAIHKGEKMPEWQHELRSLEGAGTVSVAIVGDRIRITGASGESVTLQSLGAGVPIYKGLSGSVHQFRSILAEAGIAVVQGANDATFRLAPIPGWSLLMRNGAAADVPAGVAIDELTETTTPSGNDWLLLQRNPGRELRKVKVANLRKGLVGQGTTTLSSQMEINVNNTYETVLSGTIPSASGPSTVNLHAVTRVRLGDGAGMVARGRLLLEADAGSGFAAVEPEVEVEVDHGGINPGLLQVSVPLVGLVVDASGSIAWRLRARTGTPGFRIIDQSHVTWMQFG